MSVVCYIKIHKESEVMTQFLPLRYCGGISNPVGDKVVWPNFYVLFCVGRNLAVVGSAVQIPLIASLVK